VLTQGGRTLPFTVGSKKYPEQHITLKNKRQVNPDPTTSSASTANWPSR
jgi:hypothetical protein